MKKFLFLIAIGMVLGAPPALLMVPLVVGAQTAEPQPTQSEADEQAALLQIAAQLEEIEQEVNRLTLLVTKLTLENQAADLQRQLAALMPPEESAAVAPVAAQPAETPEGIAAGVGPFPDEFFSSAPAGGKAGLAGEQDDNKASGFAAALAPLGNLGKPELAALLILAFVAMFVLARRFRGRKEESKGSAPVSPPPSSQTLSQPQGDLLQEGRPASSSLGGQELRENIVWK